MKKKKITYSWMGWIIVLLLVFLLKETQNYQEEIANEIIRFHVLANSDSAKDQKLKLQVKKEVVAYMQQALAGANNKREAEKIINDNIEEIRSIAKKTIKAAGYHYDAVAYLGNKEFPIKAYGEFVFPAGEYETLQVEIGQAKGKNWWCVMFPSLCIIDESYTVVPEEAKETLEDNLGTPAYKSLTEDTTVKYDWKIKDIWNDLWD
ncbi:MAG: stage II sporulation protein R [Lachnospiraceae bacterium]|nr:stage II sporulation protein R [Lachnospiraceae bacterium]